MAEQEKNTEVAVPSKKAPTTSPSVMKEIADKPDFLMRYVQGKLKGLAIGDVANDFDDDVILELGDYQNSKAVNQVARKLGVTVEDLYKEAKDAFIDIKEQNYSRNDINRIYAMDSIEAEMYGWANTRKTERGRIAKLYETDLPKYLTTLQIAMNNTDTTDAVTGEKVGETSDSATETLLSDKLVRVARTISEEKGFELKTDKDGYYYTEKHDPAEQLNSQDQVVNVWNAGSWKGSFMDGNKMNESWVDKLARTAVRNVWYLNPYTGAAMFAYDLIDGGIELAKSAGDLAGQEDHATANGVQNFFHKFDLDRTVDEMSNPWQMKGLIGGGAAVLSQLKGMGAMSRGLQALNVGSKTAMGVSLYGMAAMSAGDFARTTDELGIDKKYAAGMHFALVGLLGQVGRISEKLIDPVQSARGAKIVQYYLKKYMAVELAGVAPNIESKASANILKRTAKKILSGITRAAKEDKATGIKGVGVKALNSVAKGAGQLDESMSKMDPTKLGFKFAEFIEGSLTEGIEEVAENAGQELIQNGFNYFNQDKEAGKGRFQDFDGEQFMREAASAFFYGAIGGGLSNTGAGRKFFDNQTGNKVRDQLASYSVDAEGRTFIEEGIKNTIWGDQVYSFARNEDGTFKKADKDAVNDLEKLSQHEFLLNHAKSTWRFVADRADLMLNSKVEGGDWKKAINDSFGTSINASMTELNQELGKSVSTVMELEKDIRALDAQKETASPEMKKDIEQSIADKKTALEKANTDISEIVNGRRTGKFLQKWVYENNPNINNGALSWDEFLSMRDNLEKDGAETKAIHDKATEQATLVDKAVESAITGEEAINLATTAQSILPTTLKRVQDKSDEFAKPFEEELRAQAKKYLDENRPELSEQEKNNEINNYINRVKSDPERALSQTLDIDGIVDGVEGVREYESNEIFQDSTLAKFEDYGKNVLGDKDNKLLNAKVLGEFDPMAAFQYIPETLEKLDLSSTEVDRLRKDREAQEKYNDRVAAGEVLEEKDTPTPTKRVVSTTPSKNARFSATERELAEDTAPSDQIKKLKLRLQKRKQFMMNYGAFIPLNELFLMEERGGYKFTSEFSKKSIEESAMNRAIFDSSVADPTARDQVIRVWTKNQIEGQKEFVEALEHDIALLDVADKKFEASKVQPVEKLVGLGVSQAYQESDVIKKHILSLFNNEEGIKDSVPGVKESITNMERILDELDSLRPPKKDNLDDLSAMHAQAADVESRVSQLKHELHKIFTSLSIEQKSALIEAHFDELRVSEGGKLRENVFNIIASSERYDHAKFVSEAVDLLEASSGSVPTYQQRVAWFESEAYMRSKIVGDGEGTLFCDLLQDRYLQTWEGTLNDTTKQNRFKYIKFFNTFFIKASHGAGKTQFIGARALKSIQRILEKQGTRSKVLIAADNKDQRDNLKGALLKQKVELSSDSGLPMNAEQLLKILSVKDSKENPAIRDTGVIVFDEATLIPGDTQLGPINEALEAFNKKFRTDKGFPPLQLLYMGDPKQQGAYNLSDSGQAQDNNIAVARGMQSSSYIEHSMRSKVISLGNMNIRLAMHFTNLQDAVKNFNYESSYGGDTNGNMSGVRIAQKGERKESLDHIVSHADSKVPILYITDLSGDDANELEKELALKYPGQAFKISHINDVQGSEASFVVVDLHQMDFVKEADIEQMVARKLNVALSRSQQFALLINNSTNRNWTSREGVQDIAETGLTEHHYADFRKNTLAILGASKAYNHGLSPEGKDAPMKQQSPEDADSLDLTGFSKKDGSAREEAGSKQTDDSEQGEQKSSIQTLTDAIIDEVAASDLGVDDAQLERIVSSEVEQLVKRVDDLSRTLGREVTPEEVYELMTKYPLTSLSHVPSENISKLLQDLSYLLVYDSIPRFHDMTFEATLLYNGDELKGMPLEDALKIVEGTFTFHGSELNPAERAEYERVKSWLNDEHDARLKAEREGDAKAKEDANVQTPATEVLPEESGANKIPVDDGQLEIKFEEEENTLDEDTQKVQEDIEKEEDIKNAEQDNDSKVKEEKQKDLMRGFLSDFIGKKKASAFTWINHNFLPGNTMSAGRILALKESILHKLGAFDKGMEFTLHAANAKDIEDMKRELGVDTLKDVLYLKATNTITGESIVLGSFPYQSDKALFGNHKHPILRHTFKKLNRLLLSPRGVNVTEAFKDHVIRVRKTKKTIGLPTLKFGSTAPGRAMTLGDLRKQAATVGVYITSKTYLVQDTVKTTVMSNLSARKGKVVVYFSADGEALARLEEAIKNDAVIDPAQFENVKALELTNVGYQPTEIVARMKAITENPDKASLKDVLAILNSGNQKKESPRSFFSGKVSGVEIPARTRHSNPLNHLRAKTAKDKATKEIGFVSTQYLGYNEEGTPESLNQISWGTRSNTGEYNQHDIVMLEAPSASDKDAKDTLGVKYKKSLKAAIAANASFVMYSNAKGEGNELLKKALLSSGYKVVTDAKNKLTYYTKSGGMPDVTHASYNEHLKKEFTTLLNTIASKMSVRFADDFMSIFNRMSPEFQKSILNMGGKPVFSSVIQGNYVEGATNMATTNRSLGLLEGSGSSVWDTDEMLYVETDGGFTPPMVRFEEEFWDAVDKKLQEDTKLVAPETVPPQKFKPEEQIGKLTFKKDIAVLINKAANSLEQLILSKGFTVEQAKLGGKLALEYAYSVDDDLEASQALVDFMSDVVGMEDALDAFTTEVETYRSCRD